MSISKMRENEITDEVLRDYIEGRLSVKIQTELKSFLKNSKPIFFRYLAIKETLFLEKFGSSPTKSREDELLKTVLKPTKSTPYILIRIIMGQEKVSISSSDQESLDFRGVMADFAWRGSEAGPISIVRKIEGHEVVLQLVPGERKEEYFLSVKCDPSKGIVCQLIVNQTIQEETFKLQLGNFFNTHLLSTETSELKFLKNGEILFSIGIFLQSE